MPNSTNRQGPSAGRRSEKKRPIPVNQRARIDALTERASSLLGETAGEFATGDDQQRKRALASRLLGREDARISTLEAKVTRLAAKQEAARRLDRMVDQRLEEQEREFYDELRLEIIRRRGGGDNARTLEKYAQLLAMDGISLTAQAYQLARPAKLRQLVGQSDALQALCASLCSPYPQHVILYGPPGVGKTSAARLALEHAKGAAYTPFRKDAPFIEADGATLRYDPHEAVNPLLGSVHDPIYQGARKELVGGGVPEPRLGLVSDAHGGVLFIDEIGEMPPALLTKLLKVLEDKRVRFESSYFDPEEPEVPAYIRKLFMEGAPADFILIGATTRSPSELPAALRSRCAEVRFKALTREEMRRLAFGAARRMGVGATDGALRVLADASVDGRECVRLITSAYGRAVERERSTQARVTVPDARQALRARQGASFPLFSSETAVGRIFMLGIAGRRGCALRLEAAALPGEGELHFNSAAGSMARDAARNALVALRAAGIASQGLDVYLNVTGGGQVDGPSAGLAMALVMLSCLTGAPIRQDIAVTGEISLHGDVLPVGDINEKISAASSLGAKTILIPAIQSSQSPHMPGETVFPVATLREAAGVVFENNMVLK